MEPKLLELLVCPVSLKPLAYDKKQQHLVSEHAGLAYPVKNDLPVLVAEEAEKIQKKEK